MATVNQIYSLVNAASADVLGSYAPRVKDTTSFVDLGKSLSDAQELDKFFGALACRITKTVEFVRLYERNRRKIITNFIEFGSYVQKIYTELPDAAADLSWSVSNGSNPPTLTSCNPYDVTTTVNGIAVLYFDLFILSCGDVSDRICEVFKIYEFIIKFLYDFFHIF